jgi:serine protease AprX
MVVVVMVLPMASALLPYERPEVRQDDEGTSSGPAPAWPVTEARRVPMTEREWLVYAHENGRPYPPQLMDTLAPMGWDETVDVVVQFRDGTDDGDRALLDRLGLSLVRQWVGVDACLIRGPVGAVWDLLDSGATWYVEPDYELVLDMEVGTRVINASKVWSTYVQQSMGTANEPIDGRGVTTVVVDTGIDASHPDLDYGTKTLFNLRSDTGDGPYYEMENSDLGYGHGTHVAGTVSGNGDASAGARRGVAPGGNLIGITIDTDNSAGYINALDWVWQNSRPDNNPHNIRLLTNSWHSTVEEYDPQKALIALINAIAFENNVISTWSAGNDGRQDPEGQELTTSGQGNTPVGIMCAAYERDGSGVAEFSSRGKRGDTHTYPDVGAPGVQIWSCSARRTIISGGSYVGGNQNPYYLAISGTSMSTPHVAGLVSLLWQAAPSAKVSDKHEDHSGESGDWFEREDTRIHEIEWIIESTSTFVEGTGLGGNGIPERDEALDGVGLDGEPIDYVQGYGIVNAEKAVAVALTLEQLRMDNPGMDVTVADALAEYRAANEQMEREVPTDTLYASWNGEWSRFNDAEGEAIFAQNQSKFVYVPEGVDSVDVNVIYATINLVDGTAGMLTWTVDFGADGSEDQRGILTPSPNGVSSGTINAGGHEGQLWAFGVTGNGIKWQRPSKDHNYIEVRLEYSTSVRAHLAAGSGALAVDPPNLDSGYYHAYSEPWIAGRPSAEYANGTVLIPMRSYNMTTVELGRSPGEEPGPTEDGGAGGWLWWLVLVAVVILLVLVYWRYRERIALKRRLRTAGERAKSMAGRVSRRPTG